MADISKRDQTVSTDSEESFLMNQLNRSELFNSTNDSSSGNQSRQNPSLSNDSRVNTSSSSSQGRIPLVSRRSYFRESFIDEDGEDRPFTVYQDIIDESGESSRDITVLSQLNTNILAELDLNKSSNSILLQDSKRKSLMSINESKRNSDRSSKSISQYLDLSSELSDDSISAENIIKDEIVRASISSSKYSNMEARRITSDFKPRLVNITKTSESMTQTTPPVQPPSSSTTFHKQDNSDYSSTPSSNYHSGASLGQGSLSPPMSHVPSFGPPPIPKLQAVKYFQTEKLDSMERQFKDPNVVLRDVRIPSNNTTSSSNSYHTNHSIHESQSIHESLLNFEETRKKHSNRELLSQSHITKALHISSNIIPRPQLVKHDTVPIVAMAPSFVETPLSPRFPQDFCDPNHNGSTERPLTTEQYKALNLASEYHYQQTKLPQTSHHTQQSISNTNKDTLAQDDGNIAMTDYDYIPKASQMIDPSVILDASLVEKIMESRSNIEPLSQRNRSNDHTRYILFFIMSMGFLLPPLFFLLGFGLLDEFIVSSRTIKQINEKSELDGSVELIGTNIKMISLIIGCVYSLVLLACIGVGFGIGLRNYS